MKKYDSDSDSDEDLTGAPSQENLEVETDNVADQLDSITEEDADRSDEEQHHSPVVPPEENAEEDDTGESRRSKRTRFLTDRYTPDDYRISNSKRPRVNIANIMAKFPKRPLLISKRAKSASRRILKRRLKNRTLIADTGY